MIWGVVLLLAAALIGIPLSVAFTDTTVALGGVAGLLALLGVRTRSASVLTAAVDFPLIAYHAQKTALASEAWIPVLYAVAMGMDALAALVAGWLFDRLGFAVLSGVALVSALFAPLVFLGNFGVAMLGMGLWGVGMGAQESIMRAAVAEMVPAVRRGTAYGVFNTGYGLLWFAGSALMGVLYDMALPVLIAFSVVVQLMAVVMLFLVSRRRQA